MIISVICYFWKVDDGAGPVSDRKSECARKQTHRRASKRQFFSRRKGKAETCPRRVQITQGSDQLQFQVDKEGCTNVEPAWVAPEYPRKVKLLHLFFQSAR